MGLFGVFLINEEQSIYQKVVIVDQFMSAMAEQLREVLAGHHDRSSGSAGSRFKLLDQSVKSTCIAIDDAGTHGIHRIATQRALYAAHGDVGKLGAVAGQSLQRDTHTRHNGTTFKHGIVQIGKGNRSVGIDDDDR